MKSSNIFQSIFSTRISGIDKSALGMHVPPMLWRWGDIDCSTRNSWVHWRRPIEQSLSESSTSINRQTHVLVILATQTSKGTWFWFLVFIIYDKMKGNLIKQINQIQKNVMKKTFNHWTLTESMWYGGFCLQADHSSI